MEVLNSVVLSAGGLWGVGEGRGDKQDTVQHESALGCIV